jgi:hypothetical protein
VADWRRLSDGGFQVGNEEPRTMGLSLWTSSSPVGEWLLIPGGFGSPPVARAFIPSKKVEGFASEPGIDWRGSVAATGVRDVAKKSLTLVPESECACEIWADESTPAARKFKLDTADEIVGYVGEWSSRANGIAVHFAFLRRFSHDLRVGHRTRHGRG